MRVYLHLHVASQTCQLAQNSEKIWTYDSSRSSKVDDFGTNQKRICDFLLVINSTFGPILHRFWDTATWMKLRIFHTLSHSASPLNMFPLEYRDEVNHEETRVMGLLCGEGYVILTSAVWLIHPCDGRTDGQTDWQKDGGSI